ncbi:MAG TPA: hypothetical protein VIS74_02960 [Chthoniobacterales bacterium]
MSAQDIRAALAAAVSPKYRLDRDDWVKVDGEKLYRIVALKDFGDVEAGQRGGYIAGGHNLSQTGNCWVSGLGRVMKNGRVEKNALVCDFAEITDEALLTDDAQASGRGHVGGRARILDCGAVSDRARVVGAAELSDRARAGGDALISGRSTLSGAAFVHGTCVVAGTQNFSGDVDLDGGTWMGSAVPAESVLTVSGP